MTSKSTHTIGGGLPDPELFNELQQICLHATQRLFDCQSRYFGVLMELSSLQQQQLVTARTPVDLVTMQMGMMNECCARMNQCMRESFEAASASQQELLDCLEKCSYTLTLLPTAHWPPVTESSKSTGKKSTTAS